MSMNLANVVSLSYYARFDGFTSPPKEGVLRIFISLKQSISSVGSEPANLGSNCKHANHYTAGNDAEPFSDVRQIGGQSISGETNR